MKRQTNKYFASIEAESKQSVLPDAFLPHEFFLNPSLICYLFKFLF